MDVLASITSAEFDELKEEVGEENATEAYNHVRNFAAQAGCLSSNRVKLSPFGPLRRALLAAENGDCACFGLLDQVTDDVLLMIRQQIQDLYIQRRAEIMDEKDRQERLRK